MRAADGVLQRPPEPADGEVSAGRGFGDFAVLDQHRQHVGADRNALFQNTFELIELDVLRQQVVVTQRDMGRHGLSPLAPRYFFNLLMTRYALEAITATQTAAPIGCSLTSC